MRRVEEQGKLTLPNASGAVLTGKKVEFHFSAGSYPKEIDTHTVVGSEKGGGFLMVNPEGPSRARAGVEGPRATPAAEFDSKKERTTQAGDFGLVRIGRRPRVPSPGFCSGKRKVSFFFFWHCTFSLFFLFFSLLFVFSPSLSTVPFFPPRRTAPDVHGVLARRRDHDSVFELTTVSIISSLYFPRIFIRLTKNRTR